MIHELAGIPMEVGSRTEHGLCLFAEGRMLAHMMLLLSQNQEPVLQNYSTDSGLVTTLQKHTVTLTSGEKIKLGARNELVLAAPSQTNLMGKILYLNMSLEAHSEGLWQTRPFGRWAESFGMFQADLEDTDKAVASEKVLELMDQVCEELHIPPAHCGNWEKLYPTVRRAFLSKYVPDYKNR